MLNILKKIITVFLVTLFFAQLTLFIKAEDEDNYSIYPIDPQYNLKSILLHVKDGNENGGIENNMVSVGDNIAFRIFADDNNGGRTLLDRDYFDYEYDREYLKEIDSYSHNIQFVVLKDGEFSIKGKLKNDPLEREISVAITAIKALEYPYEDCELLCEVENSDGYIVSETKNPIVVIGDYLYLNVYAKKGQEKLKIATDLLSIKYEGAVASYNFPNNKYVATKEGRGLFTVKIKDDPQKRELVTSVDINNGPIISLDFITFSCDELWYLTEEIDHNHIHLDYSKTIGKEVLYRNPDTNNPVEMLHFLTSRSKDKTAQFVGERVETPDVLELKSSNEKAVKVYFGKYDSTENAPVIEIMGNGTAEIIATYKNEIRPQTAITITVENYPEKDKKSNDIPTNNISTNNNTNTPNIIDPVLDSQQRFINIENFEPLENKGTLIMVFIPLIVSVIGFLTVLIKKAGRFVVSNNDVRIVTIVLSILLFATFVGLLTFNLVNRSYIKKYNKAVEQYNNSNYQESIDICKEIEDKIDCSDIISTCSVRILIDSILNDEIISPIECNETIKRAYNDYLNSNKSYEKEKYLKVLVNELNAQTAYRKDGLNRKVVEEENKYINSVIAEANEGDLFKYGNYDFSVIKKDTNRIYAICNKVLFTDSIVDNGWKEKVNEYFEKYIESKNIILLTRKEYAEFRKYIPPLDTSWWLDDISSVTRTDVYGNIHKLRYYIVGNENPIDRGTEMIDDSQIYSNQSFSYIDNGKIGIRPTIILDYK